MKHTLLSICFALALVMSIAPRQCCAEKKSETSFSDILDLAGLPRDAIGDFSNENELDIDRWQLLAQLTYRLRQFPPTQLQQWADETSTADQASSQLGQLLAIKGIVESVELVNPPDNVSAETVLPKLFRCRFRAEDDGMHGTVLAPRIPNSWHDRRTVEEPVRFLGVSLGKGPGEDRDSRLMFSNHLAWYPKENASSGLLLLARHGMDVALLDEVKQRQPFVKPEVSREGEAFYQTLAVLSTVGSDELEKLAVEGVAAAAEESRAGHPALQQRLETLRTELAAAQGSQQREDIQQRLEVALRESALAAAVEKQAAQELSSVAPLFLRPEEQVGHLVRIEGVARRAVEIAIPETAPPGTGNLDPYYEMEVFTADSQNLPVVCCVSQLPEGFPVGDKIRESVRVDGVFFKSWLYRTRKNLADSGETGRQQRMYTPIVVGRVPKWLQASEAEQNRWGLGGGIAFFVALVVFWFTMFRLAERDRRRRAAKQPARLDELPGKH